MVFCGCFSSEEVDVVWPLLCALGVGVVGFGWVVVFVLLLECLLEELCGFHD